jgi:Iap family predicted aminopeptidase
MHLLRTAALLVFHLGSVVFAARADDTFVALRDAARASDAGHEMLVELCDRFGGRLAGTSETRAAMEWLAARLHAHGIETRFEPFDMPGWLPGEASLEMLLPVRRPMRAVAVGYSPPCEEFEAHVVDLGTGEGIDRSDTRVRGAVGLLSPHTPVPRHELQRRASTLGLRALLQINREGGGQLLARSGSLAGETLAVPTFSITQEEGFWIRRSLARGDDVRVRLASDARPLPIATANLSVAFPGTSGATIVVGAHFDSWHLGQGAMDNGLGVAQLYHAALLLKRHAPRNHHAIELVWLEGEELGLWGSRHRAEVDRTRPIVAMVNLDMVGHPRSVNALGYRDLLPTLERFRDVYGSDALPDGVDDTPWIASDHTPYMLAGMRAVTFGAPIPRESVRYYHDFADTIDKVDPAMLREGVAAAVALVHHLANDTTLEARRVPDEETIAVFESKNLVPRLKNDGFWPFAEAPTVPSP